MGKNKKRSYYIWYLREAGKDDDDDDDDDDDVVMQSWTKKRFGQASVGAVAAMRLSDAGKTLGEILVSAFAGPFGN